MTYSIKRLRNKGDYSLTNMQSVDNLDQFVSEVNKATRLWIDNLDVFVRSEDIPSPVDYIRFKCEIDPDYFSESSQFLMFYGTELKSLASTIERVLGLPDSHQDRIIELSGPTGNDTYMDLIFSPELLQSMLSAHETRSYMFVNFNITPEQSVLLAAKTNMNCLRWCTVSDDGNALVDYLEHHNETRTLGTFSNQLNDAWEEIVTFLGRSPYPVFDDLVLDQNNIHFCNSYRHELVVQANVKSMAVIINPFLFEEGECEPLVEALRDGTFVPPKLRLCFDTGHPVLDDDIVLYETVLRDMFNAMSSTDKHQLKLRLYFDTSDPFQDEDELENYDFAIQSLFVAMCSADCQLKELYVHVKTAHIGTILLVGAEYLPRMLKINKSLETLGIEIPEPEVLDIVAEHPRIWKLVFVVPYNLDPFASNDTRELAEWFRKHPSHQIQYEHATRIFPHEGRRVVAKSQVKIWHYFVFFSRFALLQKVKDERVRSHLLVTTLANHSSSPQRVHFLLNENLDLFAT